MSLKSKFTKPYNPLKRVQIVPLKREYQEHLQSVRTFIEQVSKFGIDNIDVTPLT